MEESAKGIEAFGAPRETQRRPPGGSRVAVFGMYVRRRPTLPRGPPRSTIGAIGLSFRVRNGTGRFPDAMTAETLWRCPGHHTPPGPMGLARLVAPTAPREPHS